MHPLGEGEALAAGAWADLDNDVAKLAMPARLLFVSSSHPDGVTNRFPVGNRRFVRLDGYAEAVGEPLGGHAQVHLALPEQLQFRHLGVLDIRQPAVLIAEFGQRAGEPNLVLSILDADGDSLSCRRSASRRAERGSGSPGSDAIAGGE